MIKKNTNEWNNCDCIVKQITLLQNPLFILCN